MRCSKCGNDIGLRVVASHSTVRGCNWIKSAEKYFIMHKESTWRYDLDFQKYKGLVDVRTYTTLQRVKRHLCNVWSVHLNQAGEKCSDCFTPFLTAKNKDCWCHKSTITVHHKLRESLLCCVNAVRRKKTLVFTFLSILVYIRHGADTAWGTCCLLVFVLTCFLVQCAGYWGEAGVSCTAQCC